MINYVQTILIGIVIAIFFYWRRSKRISRQNKIKNDIHGIDLQLFSPATISKLYELHQTHLIKVNEAKGGILDTQNLSVLHKSFVDPFINAKVEKKTNFKNVIVFYNPIAGFGTNSAHYRMSNVILKLLEKHSINYTVIKSLKKKYFTSYLIDVANKTNIINKYKPDMFIVIGGDGTFKEFINGYILGKYTEYNIPIIFIPGGSHNVLCTQLNYNKDWLLDLNNSDMIKAFDGLLKRSKSELDVTYIDVMKVSSTKSVSCEYVIVTALFGFVSGVVKIAESLRSTVVDGCRVEIGSYIQILRKPTFKYRLIAYFDDMRTMEFDVELITLFCSKTKRIAKNVIAVPFCKSDNGFMDVMIVLNASRYHFVKLNLSEFPKGTQILNSTGKNLIILRCKKLKILPFKGDNDVSIIDGEIGPATPCSISCVSNILPVIPMTSS